MARLAGPTRLGWFRRLIYFFVRRRLGRVPAPLAITAHHRVALKDGHSYVPELTVVNGESAFVGRVEGRAAVVITVETDGERIRKIYVVRNPDKLARFDEPR